MGSDVGVADAGVCGCGKCRIADIRRQVECDSGLVIATGVGIFAAGAAAFIESGLVNYLNVNGFVRFCEGDIGVDGDGGDVAFGRFGRIEVEGDGITASEILTVVVVAFGSLVLGEDIA